MLLCAVNVLLGLLVFFAWRKAAPGWQRDVALLGAIVAILSAVLVLAVVFSPANQ